MFNFVFIYLLFRVIIVFMKNILIINGSPKGEYSCTLYTSLFLEKKFKDLKFSILHAGSQIHKFERDFSEAKTAISSADLIIFSYPVYTFICPSQLHKFISLMKDQQMDLSNKFATQITTSKHFYDITAHAYIQQNCNDLGLKYLKGFSADMDDLTKISGQNEAISFFKKTLWLMDNNIFEQPTLNHPYTKINASLNNLSPVSTIFQKNEKTIALLRNSETEDPNLSIMIERFSKEFPYTIKTVDISQIGMKGGCISCFNCATTGNCIYKDNYQNILLNEINTADAIVHAFTITDHSFGPTYKMFTDRQFCNGHRTVNRGKSVAYLISGNLTTETNVKTIIEARAEVGGTFLAGIATDELNPDTQIDQLTKTLTYALETKYTQPSNFYGVGGMKIFRDLIYITGGFMKADYKFYKSHGQFDFPQKQRKTRFFMKLVGLLMTPKIMSKAGSKVREGMISPYKKVLKDL